MKQLFCNYSFQLKKLDAANEKNISHVNPSNVLTNLDTTDYSADNSTDYSVISTYSLEDVTDFPPLPIKPTGTKSAKSLTTAARQTKLTNYATALSIRPRTTMPVPAATHMGKQPLDTATHSKIMPVASNKVTSSATTVAPLLSKTTFVGGGDSGIPVESDPSDYRLEYRLEYRLDCELTQCSCRFWLQYNLPCRHIFVLHEKMDMPIFEKKLIPKRWQKITLRKFSLRPLASNTKSESNPKKITKTH